MGGGRHENGQRGAGGRAVKHLSFFTTALLIFSAQAHAHESRPAYLQLTELTPGQFAVLWKVPQRGDLVLGLHVRWPDGCRSPSLAHELLGSAAVARGLLDCSDTGLAGQRIVIDGLAATLTDCLTRIEWLDGRVQTSLLNPRSPELHADGQSAATQVAAEYLCLGIDHILGGVDHLLFVLGLLLIVRGAGLLIKTITAFTLAHSVTLGLAALGFVHVPQAPVEAVIALSILFLARELLRQLHGEQVRTAQCPWTVAMSFGLLHGFGFAGALSEVGLPAGDIPLALLFFNLGVEFGQLMFVGAALAVIFAIRRIPIAVPDWAPVVPSYAIGSVAMFWVIQRIAAF